MSLGVCCLLLSATVIVVSEHDNQWRGEERWVIC